MSKLTIKDLKEFIDRHELDDDTEINIVVGSRVLDAIECNVASTYNGKPMKHELVIANYEEI